MNNFISLISKREKILLIVIFFGAFVVSIVETLSLGSIAGFVMLISNPDILVDKLPEGDLKQYLSSLEIQLFIFYFSIIIILLFVLKNIFVLGYNYFSMWIERNILSNLSNKLLLIYLNQQYLFHIKNNPSKLTNSIISETARSVAFIFTYLNIIREIMVLSFLFITTLFIDYKLSILILFLMGLASIIFMIFMKNVLAKLGIESKVYAETRLKTLSEIFGIIKVIKLYNASQYFQKVFNHNNLKKLKTENLNRFINLIPRAFLEILAIITISVITYYFLYNDYSINNITPILTLLAILLIRAIPAFGIINVSVSVLQYHKESMKNIVNEFYKYKIIEDDSKKIKKIEKDIESIEIKNLFFSYPNSKHYVLRNLNFILNKNECVGIIGGSGEGKSTLIDLILGLFSPSKGEVLVNNLKFPLHQSYVDKIGYVPQDVYLTDDTIKNNIALGVAEDLIDEKKINKIIKVLKLEQLVSESKYGLNTLVGNRGVKLSGGQRQRIGIARAFYKESQVIILDEATNALDLKTEKEIISYVINNKKDKIIIIINHRTDMLKDCDKIISIEKGEIVEKK